MHIQTQRPTKLRTHMPTCMRRPYYMELYVHAVVMPGRNVLGENVMEKCLGMPGRMPGDIVDP